MVTSKQKSSEYLATPDVQSRFLLVVSMNRQGRHPYGAKGLWHVMSDLERMNISKCKKERHKHERKGGCHPRCEYDGCRPYDVTP
jgi:hypothetical protein